MPRKRTNRKLVELIFDQLKKNQRMFKSDFEKFGLNNYSINDWVELICFIQSQPKLKTIKQNRITMYELESL